MTGAESDPQPTQRDHPTGIAAELSAAGFSAPEQIGRGGFGVVYRCTQQALDRTVAVKVLTADLEPDNLERFVREQVAMGKLSGHPHITTIFQVGATPSGRPYIVMQYHPNGSLDTRIRHRGPLDWRETLRLGIQLAGALETAHRLGTLHRDVKPANILLTEYGEPQLTDFGIARISGGFETTDGLITGSPAYTAPEVLQGETPRVGSDVYSLASTLFCAATGHAVFERRKGEQMLAQFLRITKHPVPDMRDSGLPADVCAVIEAAMARDLSARPQSAAAFGEQLREVQRRHGVPVDDLKIPTAVPANPATAAPANPATAAPANLTTAARGAAHPRSSDTLLAEYPARPATPPAPATRFRLPALSRALVHRTRLIGRLRAGQDKKLTVIHGPTGFGKSTLAAQWAKTLAADGVSVAWLTVDHDDNHLVWFLSHLIEAIRAVTPALAGELGEVLQEHGDEAERYVLTSLINEIQRNGARMTVVIDDWHLVTDPGTIRALRYLLDNAGGGLTVIVTGRHQRGLPMSRMRMQDELVEIDTTALRFDDAESASFLAQCGGLELDPVAVQELTSKTDGWVAALQLASLSLRGTEDPARLIGTMTGRHHVISEFLADNVLNTLEPEILQFLLATSVTERICGPLASVLAGVPDGQALLDQVQERDLFLRRVDDQWFRYHQLFADFLRHRLDRDQPGRLTELHTLASEWFAGQHMVSEAVDHALAAGDDERAVCLVEKDGTQLVANSQAANLLGLVDKLPRPAVTTHPRLQLALAWANTVLQRIPAAERALETFESTLGGSVSAGWGADELVDIRTEADVVRAVVAVRADRLTCIDEYVAGCLAQPDRVRPFVVATAANAATFCAAYRYDIDAVNRIQSWAAPYYDCSGDSYSRVNGLCFTGIAHRQMLDMPAAEACFRQALKSARHAGGAHSYTARLASSLLGELLYEQGDLEAAERLLDEGYKLGPEGGSVDFKTARYVIGARIKAVQGDRQAAVQRLDEAARVARALSLPRLQALVENERFRLGLPPHPEFGPPAITTYGSRRRAEHPIDQITVQHEEGTAIRLLLISADPDKQELACRWAGEWVDLLAAHGRPRPLLQARRLLVACLAAAGRLDEAKSALAPIAAQCAQLKMVRYLHDGGPYVVATLAALLTDQRSGWWRSEWPHVPTEFLDQATRSDPAQRV